MLTGQTGWSSVNPLGLYAGGAHHQSHLGHCLLSMIFPVILFTPSRQMPVQDLV
jgi:hypothetical protein